MNRLLLAVCVSLGTFRSLAAAPLLAGVGRAEITDRAAGPVHDPCYVKALALQQGETAAVLLTVDAVAIGEIGRLGNAFLETVRGQLAKDPGIPPTGVLVNASHCHGVVRADSAELAVQAAREAWRRRAPVRVGAGVGTESRISENRRLKLTDGSEADMRRAYAMPSDDQIAAPGPIDPQIGLLRLDRADGTPLALVYNFACHPIMNPPSKGNSADFPGVASRVIEEALGPGTMAFFVQGCGGDINPLRYKEPAVPPDAEPLGQRLGLSALRAARAIETKAEAALHTSHAVVAVPLAEDFAPRIAAIQSEQARLLAALTPTNLQFKSFLPLLLAQKLSPEFPAAYAQSYLHDRAQSRDDLDRLDTEHRAAVEAYLRNIQVMEQLTRLNVNLALLKKHQARVAAAARPTIDAECCGLRVGPFKLVTFPGELTVQIGLNVKRAAADPGAFVAGYTNGYLYYLPTAEQRANRGYAQEDCDCLVAPAWQRIFESLAVETLRKL